MAVNLQKFNVDVGFIGKLDDNPNEGATPLSSTDLKDEFDKAGKSIKTFLNGTLIDELETILTNMQTTETNQGTAITNVTTTANTNATNIGTMSNLTTTANTLVGAINEVKTSMSTSNVIWTGGYYMGSSQTANLSQKVTDQKNGIILVWSAYASGQSQNYNWNFVFVPKQFITTAGEGNGVSCFLTGSSMGSIGYKYVYVNDTTITGASINEESGTKNGISYNGKLYVLRYVIGV